MVNSGILHQIIAITPVCYNEFTMGMGYGWTAPILTKLRSSAEYTVEELSWIGSTHDFGRVIGPILAALLLDNIGRKRILILCSIILLLSWFGIFFFKNVLGICLSRLLFGIGNGMNDMTSPVYLGENYPRKVRGIFCSFITISFCLAELIQFIIASWLAYETIAAINIVIALIGVCTTVWLVETPQFLLLKNQFHLAKTNFLWLRGVVEGSPENVSEFEKIKVNIEEERLKKNSYKELLRARANYKSLIIVFMLNIFTIGTGYAAVIAYMTMVFSSSGSFSEYQYTIAFGVVQLTACSFLPIYIERFDRRTLVLLSYLLIAISHVATAALLYTQENITTVPYSSWLVFAFISAYGAIYAVLYPVVHMIRGELFPQSIKAFGGLVAITVYSAMAFLTSRTFLAIASSYGTYVNFLLYALLSILALIYNYLQLPETKGKLLVDIQTYLEK